MVGSDLISRRCLSIALAQYVSSNAYLNQTALDALEMVMRWVYEAHDEDAVAVVRCGKCRHADPYRMEAGKTYCQRYDRVVPMDGYCQDGKPGQQTSIDVDLCRYFYDGRCMGTREADPCEGDHCTRMVREEKME